MVVGLRAAVVDVVVADRGQGGDVAGDGVAEARRALVAVAVARRPAAGFLGRRQQQAGADAAERRPRSEREIFLFRGEVLSFPARSGRGQIGQLGGGQAGQLVGGQAALRGARQRPAQFGEAEIAEVLPQIGMGREAQVLGLGLVAHRDRAGRRGAAVDGLHAREAAQVKEQPLRHQGDVAGGVEVLADLGRGAGAVIRQLGGVGDGGVGAHGLAVDQHGGGELGDEGALARAVQLLQMVVHSARPRVPARSSSPRWRACRRGRPAAPRAAGAGRRPGSWCRFPAAVGRWPAGRRAPAPQPPAGRRADFCVARLGVPFATA